MPRGQKGEHSSRVCVPPCFSSIEVQQSATRDRTRCNGGEWDCGYEGPGDPVDRYLPSGFSTPQRNGRAITLADLATHTSGLPLFPPITGNLLEALARYTASDLRSWLASLTLSL